MWWLLAGLVYAAYVVGHVRGWGKGKAAGEVAMLSIANTNSERLVLMLDALSYRNQQLTTLLRHYAPQVIEPVTEERAN